MITLTMCREALRIKSNAFDDEILDLIAAAIADLALVGITKAEDVHDPLIKMAIKTYVKANFGWDNPDKESLHQSYLQQKMSLSVAGGYNALE